MSACFAGAFARLGGEQAGIRAIEPQWSKRGISVGRRQRRRARHAQKDVALSPDNPDKATIADAGAKPPLGARLEPRMIIDSFCRADRR
jgi:hypothetical protein